jgi:thioredoxin 1
MSATVKAVTTATFPSEVINASTSQPVLVDFWAPWCGPCRIVAPHLEELNNERQDLRVVKLNVDDNPQTAAQYGVMSIPTLILFKGGQEAKKIIGALPKKRLEQELEPALA